MLGMAIIVLLGVVCGCGNETEERIRNDYLSYLHSQGETDATLSDVKILQNYGNYNGTVVIKMERGAFEIITEVQVGGINFRFGNTNTAIAWRNGQFYELEEAYDTGFLTTDDLTAIASKINKVI